IKYWSIESLDGLNDLGRMAQEKIMGIPARLERIAEIMEKKTKPKSFAFDVVFNRVFAME
ncbi:MAG TPA: acyl-ACP desaturase, partial [Gemmatimonadaceae bacterium]|nr:acyl-ACP desaturase [Gemmatimonadaceae bacterium]